MARKLGILDQLLFGDLADRAAINRNAEDLSLVETNLAELRVIVQSQASEILQLRALLTGVVEVLREKVAFNDAELESAVRAAWDKLVPPPPPQKTDPHRGIPSEPSSADIEAAKALLASAQDHHFGKRFQEARPIYEQIVERYGDTKQAVIARQQLENLRKA